ncbi:MAG TPA: PEP-utilizing enzyme [Nocardioides sp.]|uniref:PEP-utilizing enzyme n=1 Tax=Nocardioides sp. TaxID=35761 RepID=UPI002F42A640
MTDTDIETGSRIEPPGPGTWELDPVHFPRPVTRYYATTSHAFRRGTAEVMAYYGMPIEAMLSEVVGGFVYHQMVPVDPAEMPARIQRAEEVFADKLWRDQLREWDEVAKPASIQRHRDLQAVDPDALSDAELCDYLTRCQDHHAEMRYQHMRFTGAAVVSVGDLLAHAVEWAHVSPADVLATTRGAAPVSAGASAEQERLVAALAGDSAARDLLESDDDPAMVLDKLRTLGNEVSEAVSAYLDLVGCRLLDGFDISGRYALEMPDALVRTIRAWAAGRAETGPDPEHKLAEMRAQVPEEHRAEFDDLVAEARLMSRIRDERGVYSDIWASGIMRRAALGAGRRLASTGRLLEPEHIVDATVEEMVQIISGQGGPSAEELAGRAAYRAAHTAKDAPPVLGPPPTPPPPPDGLPPAAARMVRAFGTAMSMLFGSFEPAADDEEREALRGLSASGGVYVGPARLVHGPADFDRIQEGDVLVTESTTEAFNILLPLLGAIVTDSGGLLSHSAIVAREYGIPGVVGTREATSRFTDGMRLRVDGDAGEVTTVS